MESHYMQGLDWLILAVYFAVLIAIGIWASTKRKKESSLFLAEHSLRWHHIGFSMWGTNVGPSMLIASASAGFTTGIVSGNYAWYAFVFIALLAFVFAPRYLGANISTLPEFMGLRFGQSTRNILAWYLMACPDPLRWWHPDSSGLRHPHVDVSVGTSYYLCFLHYVGRPEGRCLHQCLSDDPAHCCFIDIGHCRS